MGFFHNWGATTLYKPQIGIYDFQLFGLQVFAPIDFLLKIMFVRKQVQKKDLVLVELMDARCGQIAAKCTLC